MKQGQVKQIYITTTFYTSTTDKDGYITFQTYL